MRTWRSRLSRFSPVVLSIAGCLATCVNANSQELQQALNSSGTYPVQVEREDLFLDVTVNGMSISRLSQFVRQGRELFATSETLAALGFRFGAKEKDSQLIALHSLPGLQVKYNAKYQQLSLVAPLDLLDRPVARISATSAFNLPTLATSSIPGLVYNYDVYAQLDEGKTSVSGVSEARVFGLGSGVWKSTMVTRASQGGDQISSYSNLRLDTSWQRDFPEDMVSLAVGDFVTGGLGWTRSARLGGIRLSRNFTLQPFRGTSPLASFSGSALLPSTVDLFINGLKQSSDQVQPGKFELRGIPSFNGLGNAQVVLTDINGQAHTYDMDLYGTPQLLSKGLFDWSLEYGGQRLDYGVNPFSYSDGIASVTGRFGFSDSTTLEGHAELGGVTRQAGVGAIMLIGERAGVLSGSFSSSSAGGESGAQWSSGYQWKASQFSFALNSIRRNPSFRYAASLPNETIGKGSDSAAIGATGVWGSLGLNIVRQQYFDAPTSGLINISWAPPMPKGGTVNISINRSFGLQNDRGDSGRIGVYAFLSIPLDRYTSLSTVAQSGSGGRAISFGASRSPSGRLDEIGWNAQVNSNGGATGGNFELSKSEHYGQFGAGLSWIGETADRSSARSIHVNASGGVVVAAGRIYASRRVDDAFAVVSTNGVPHVPVSLENRKVGETDSTGILFVSQLNAYQRNQLTIDTEALPFDMRIGESLLYAVPEARSGVFIKFDLRQVRALEVEIRDVKGRLIPPGSPVHIASGDSDSNIAVKETIVGYDGIVYLEDALQGTVLTVDSPSGSCQVAVPEIERAKAPGFHGALTCR